MRVKIKMWRNGKGGQIGAVGEWNARITWYQGPYDDIRLKIDTVDGVRNIFPKSREEADVIWEEFKENNQRPKDSSTDDISPNPFFK